MHSLSIQPLIHGLSTLMEMGGAFKEAKVELKEGRVELKEGKDALRSIRDVGMEMRGEGMSMRLGRPSARR